MNSIFEMLFILVFVLVAALLVSFILLKVIQALLGSRVACVIAGLLMIMIFIAMLSGMESYQTFPTNGTHHTDVWTFVVLFPSVSIVFALTLLVTMSEGLWEALKAVFKYSAIFCIACSIILDVFEIMWIGYPIMIIGFIGLVWVWLRNE